MADAEKREMFSADLDLYTALIDLAPDVMALPKIQHIIELSRKVVTPREAKLREALIALRNDIQTTRILNEAHNYYWILKSIDTILESNN